MKISSVLLAVVALMFITPAQAGAQEEAAPAPAALTETAAVPAEAEEDAEDEAPEIDPTAANPAPAHPELRPVLAEFGGEAGLKALMDDFMVGLLAHPRTKPFFENSDNETIKKHLTSQFCVILGGDCRYEGTDMKTSHQFLGIDRADFNALVEVLQVTMAKRDIPFRAQNKLLAKLAPMHREIITE